MPGYSIVIIVIKLVFVLVLLSCASSATDTNTSPRQDSLKPADNQFVNQNPENTNPVDMSVTVPKIPIELLTGKLSGAQRDSILISVPIPEANRSGLLMHREAYQAFQKMRSSAMDDGIELTVISAFRDFNHQKRIWENKWNGHQMLSGNINAVSIENPTQRASEILKYSSMPGTSRHHWGTDIDINSLSNSYFNSGKGLAEYQWLVANAARFGFCQPYTSRDSGRVVGYEEEKWHWSYIPVASQYQTVYQQKVSYNDISGFDGAETAEHLQVIREYVLGINPQCFTDHQNVE